MKSKTPTAPAPDTPVATAADAAPDEFHGVGGSYMIGEDGVRRQVEAPTAPAEKE